MLTQYRYRVRAINDVGPGPWSPVVTVATTSEQHHYCYFVNIARVCMHIHNLYMYTRSVWLPGQPKSAENLHKAILRGDTEMIQTILEAK